MLFRPSPTKKRPGLIAPCIPTLASRPPEGPQWVHEIKHDGYRLIARKTGGPGPPETPRENFYGQPASPTGEHPDRRCINGCTLTSSLRDTVWLVSAPSKFTTSGP
jgi:hypothetical protein